MDYIDIEGLQIGYRRAGEGPPLVLLHGGPTHSGEFRKQLEGLSDQFTVIAWDMPGCGQSSDPPEHFRIRDYTTWPAWLASSRRLAWSRRMSRARSAAGVR
ncbi:MAG: alpha/beta fold hydrolase [Chloroflexi bacterium]|nr:alpha/beta fold hydrolase [Chloroflexota bacterium]